MSKKLSQVDKQRTALNKADADAYAALSAAEDELFRLEDRQARRGDGPSVEGQ